MVYATSTSPQRMFLSRTIEPCQNCLRCDGLVIFSLFVFIARRIVHTVAPQICRTAIRQLNRNAACRTVNTNFVVAGERRPAPRFREAARWRPSVLGKAICQVQVFNSSKGRPVEYVPLICATGIAVQTANNRAENRRKAGRIAFKIRGIRWMRRMRWLWAPPVGCLCSGSCPSR